MSHGGRGVREQLGGDLAASQGQPTIASQVAHMILAIPGAYVWEFRNPIYVCIIRKKALEVSMGTLKAKCCMQLGSHSTWRLD